MKKSKNYFMLTKQMSKFSRFKPAVPKCWLFAASGIMWCIVGLMMCTSGVGWLASEPLPLCRTMGVFGIILAFLAFRKGFGKIANRNIIRLRRLPEQGCIFAFQAWKSYIIIFIMIVLGITLRQSPLPKSILAIIYITIGGGLFLSSFFYFKHVRRIIRTARLRHAAYIKKAKPNQGIN